MGEIEIKVSVGIWDKDITVFDVDDDDEVGRAIGEAVGFMVKKMSEKKGLGSKN